MAVGVQTSMGNINQALTSMSVNTRDLATVVLQKWSQYNKLGVPGLEALGFSAEDAQAVLDNINHLVIPFQVYKGLAAQPDEFNFEDFLTPLWGDG